MVYLLKLSGFKNSEISLTYMVSDLYGHLALSDRDFDLYGEPYKSEITVEASSRILIWIRDKSPSNHQHPFRQVITWEALLTPDDTNVIQVSTWARQAVVNSDVTVQM